MRRDTTTEYPTRYAAFRTPGVLFTYAGERDPYTAGGEVAVFHEPRQNVDWPNLRDGIYAEVYALHPAGQRGLYAIVNATRPDVSRHQRNVGRAFPPDGSDRAALDAARDLALAFVADEIEAARAWLARPTVDVLRESAEAIRRRVLASGVERDVNTAQTIRNADNLDAIADAIERGERGRVAL